MCCDLGYSDQTKWSEELWGLRESAWWIRKRHNWIQGELFKISKIIPDPKPFWPTIFGANTSHIWRRRDKLLERKTSLVESCFAFRNRKMPKSHSVSVHWLNCLENKDFECGQRVEDKLPAYSPMVSPELNAVPHSCHSTPPQDRFLDLFFWSASNLCKETERVFTICEELIVSNKKFSPKSTRCNCTLDSDIFCKWTLSWWILWRFWCS